MQFPGWKQIIKKEQRKSLLHWIKLTKASVKTISKLVQNTSKRQQRSRFSHQRTISEYEKIRSPPPQLMDRNSHRASTHRVRSAPTPVSTFELPHANRKNKKIIESKRKANFLLLWTTQQLQLLQPFASPSNKSTKIQFKLYVSNTGLRLYQYMYVYIGCTVEFVVLALVSLSKNFTGWINRLCSSWFWIFSL